MQLGVTNLPEIVANIFGISVFAGGLFCALVLFLATLIPLLWVAHGKATVYIIMVDGILVTAFAVAVGWVDYWILLLIALACAVGLADQLSKKV